MPSADKLTTDDRFIGLFIGRSGSGKKVAACSFPHPIKYYDFDGRIRGLLGASWVERKGIDYTYYPPVARLGESTFQNLNKDLEALQTQAISGQLPYKTIVLASLTGEALAFLNDSIPLTHQGKKGRSIGALNMPDPGDYGYQSVAMHQVISFFRSVPGINLIVCAHMIERYGQVPGPDGTINPYGEKVVVGERLALTDKLGETIPAFFDNIFRFEKQEVNGRIKHYAAFRGDLPRTTYAGLPNGSVDITDKDFYQYLLSKTAPSGVPVEVKK